MDRYCGAPRAEHGQGAVRGRGGAALRWQVRGSLPMPTDALPTVARTVPSSEHKVLEHAVLKGGAGWVGLTMAHATPSKASLA